VIVDANVRGWCRGTRDNRLFETGRRVRVRPGACTNPRYDTTGKEGVLGRPRGQGRFDVILDDGPTLNFSGKYLEFL